MEIAIPRNSFGKNLLNLRRKLVKTLEFCKNAGEFKKCRIYRCMLKQQNTEKSPITITPELRAITPELWALTPAGNMNNYFNKSASQNCRRGLKNAGKHQKAPFTRQSFPFPKRQK
jgi:hypothetical protein